MDGHGNFLNLMKLVLLALEVELRITSTIKGTIDPVGFLPKMQLESLMMYLFLVIALIVAIDYVFGGLMPQKVLTFMHLILAIIMVQ